MIYRLNGRNLSFYELLKLSYSGIKSYISKVVSVEELYELKEWCREIRWLFGIECEKLGRTEDYIESEKELEQVFKIKSNKLCKRV